MSTTDQTSVKPVELVPVGADTLSVLRQDGAGWLVLKPACEALGVDAEAQRKRLERMPWATASMMEAVGADGRQREMYCLRTDRVAMWLATIETSRIADPEARKRLERWQCNAAEALDRWFRGPSAPASAPAAAATPAGIDQRLDQLISRFENLEGLLCAGRTPTLQAPEPEPLLDFSIKSLAAATDIPKFIVFSWIQAGVIRAEKIDKKWIIRLTLSEIEALRKRKGMRGVPW